MSDPVEAVPPLFVEQALMGVTAHRSSVHGGEIGAGLQYPAQLGSLAVDRLRFDPDYDVERVAHGVRADFDTSYVMDNVEAPAVVRQRSMAWLDGLAQNTNLDVRSSTYLDVATVAAEHGDVATVLRIIEEPKRLGWMSGAVFR